MPNTMDLILPNRIKTLLTVLLPAVVLFLAVSSGMNSGKVKAQALSVASSAKEISIGLKYFYSDYGRFPTATEYQNQNLMLNYFDQFPPQDFVSDKCGQSVLYKRVSNSSFLFNFCLPQSAGQYKSGWNQVNQDTEF